MPLLRLRATHVRRCSVERLARSCLAQLHACLSVNNAVSYFLWAHDHDLPQLRQVAFGFVTQNFRAIKSSDKDTLRLLRDRPDLLMEIMEAL